LEYISPSENVKHAFDTGTKSTAKKVGQFNLEGKLIKVYNSIEEAANETGIRGTIAKVCTGNTNNKTAGGFIWRHLDENNNIIEKVQEVLPEMTKIKDFPNYSITKDGRFYSHNRKKFIPPSKVDGYLRVKLSNDKEIKSVMVHKLVAQTYIPNPNNYQYVTRKNKNKEDNRVENLQWSEKTKK
jgi:phenylpropionate dioxygenase-like ring-hydroxylating dioxygenase large terminal subunit